MKLKNIVAIIPARAGSKGLKNKNIIDLCGKPLMAYSIEAALKAECFQGLLYLPTRKDMQKLQKTMVRK